MSQGLLLWPRSDRAVTGKDAGELPILAIDESNSVSRWSDARAMRCVYGKRRKKCSSDVLYLWRCSVQAQIVARRELRSRDA